MAVDEGAIHYIDVIIGAAALEQHVLAAGGYECQTRNDPVIAFGLSYLDLAQVVEPLGKGGGELLRHVLHYDDAGTDPRQVRQHGFQSLGTAGGGADRHDPLRGLGHGMLACRWHDGIGAEFGGHD